MTEYEEYKLIALNDPGGDIETALASMLAETEFGHIITGNELLIWAAQFNVDYSNMKVLATDMNNVACEMCLKLFESTDSGVLSLANPVLKGMLDSFLAEGILTPKGHAALLDLATVQVYPKLTKQKLQNARDQKAKGVV